MIKINADDYAFPKFNTVLPEQTDKLVLPLDQDLTIMLRSALERLGINTKPTVVNVGGVKAAVATIQDQDAVAKKLLLECEQARDESTSTHRVVSVVGYLLLDGVTHMWDFMSFIITDDQLFLVPRHHLRKFSL